ncbi:MAG: hypothetical protein NVSMB38_14140 [Ktedonobacteraceae bacterium]
MQEDVSQETAITYSAETEQVPVEETRRVTTLTASRQRAYTADLMKAHIALMEKEVILPKQVELFRLVNRNYRALQTWHDQFTGWRIQRTTTVIRLIRTLSAATPGYLYERLKEPHDFACLTWILWFAEHRQLTGRGNDQQFLLSQLAQQIQEQSTTDEVVTFDFRRPTDRYSIQRALQTLEDLGGLQLVDGQTREWVEQARDADVLYEFTDVIRSLVAALDPQKVTLLAERLKESSTQLHPTLLADAFSTPSLTRAWRALLLGPALFRFDDPDAFTDAVHHAESIAHELLENFGWQLDIHRDYACIVRASGMTTGPVTSLTPFGTNDQIALLLCKAIREQVLAGSWVAPDSYGCLHVTTEDMTALFYVVRDRYSDNWGTEARNKSSRSLLNDVYRKMRQAGLLRGPDEHGNVMILPTAARYNASYDKAELEDQGPALRPRGKSTTKKAPTTVNAKLPGLDGKDMTRTSGRK